jgi:hypothetical protein
MKKHLAKQKQSGHRIGVCPDDGVLLPALAQRFSFRTGQAENQKTGLTLPTMVRVLPQSLKKTQPTLFQLLS